MKVITLCLALVPVSANAESVAPYLLSSDISNIISVITPNFESSAGFKAVLLKQGEVVSLYIYEAPFARRPTAYAPRVTYSGDRLGSIPWLAFADNGALFVYNENRAAGRIRWTSKLTIQKLNGDYVVSAFDFGAYDTLDLEYAYSCNFDFVAGEATINALPIEVPINMAPIPIREWQESIVADCLNRA
jgi:hypothetical protein